MNIQQVFQFAIDYIELPSPAFQKKYRVKLRTHRRVISNDVIDALQALKEHVARAVRTQEKRKREMKTLRTRTVKRKEE